MEYCFKNLFMALYVHLVLAHHKHFIHLFFVRVLVLSFRNQYKAAPPSVYWQIAAPWLSIIANIWKILISSAINIDTLLSFYASCTSIYILSSLTFIFSDRHTHFWDLILWLCSFKMPSYSHKLFVFISFHSISYKL